MDFCLEFDEVGNCKDAITHTISATWKANAEMVTTTDKTKILGQSGVLVKGDFNVREATASGIMDTESLGMSIICSDRRQMGGIAVESFGPTAPQELSPSAT